MSIDDTRVELNLTPELTKEEFLNFSSVLSDRAQPQVVGLGLMPYLASVQAHSPFLYVPLTAEFAIKVTREAKGRVGILPGCCYSHLERRTPSNCINWEVHYHGFPRIW